MFILGFLIFRLAELLVTICIFFVVALIITMFILPFVTYVLLLLFNFDCERFVKLFEVMLFLTILFAFVFWIGL